MPDTVYVIDGGGTVVLRAQWNHPELVEQALRAGGRQNAAHRPVRDLRVGHDVAGTPVG
jgi:hypothetical protein